MAGALKVSKIPPLPLPFPPPPPPHTHSTRPGVALLILAADPPAPSQPVQQRQCIGQRLATACRCTQAHVMSVTGATGKHAPYCGLHREQLVEVQLFPQAGCERRCKANYVV